jgi:hypothetical protein
LETIISEQRKSGDGSLFSKSAIFQDRHHSLLQKRELMRFVLYFLPQANWGLQHNTSNIAEKVAEFEGRLFSELLAELKFEEELSGAFEYGRRFRRAMLFHGFGRLVHLLGDTDRLRSL